MNTDNTAEQPIGSCSEPTSHSSLAVRKLGFLYDRYGRIPKLLNLFYLKKVSGKSLPIFKVKKDGEKVKRKD